MGFHAGAPAPAPAPTPGAPGPRIAETLCPVVENRPVNAEYRLLTVEAPAVALAAVSGQFFHLLCPPAGADRPFLRRPMSIFRIDREAGRLSFLYKVTGVGARGLATLVPGDTLDAMGPLGVGFTLPEGTKRVLMVARGVSLATLGPLAAEAAAAGAQVAALLSARRPDLLMSREELAAAGAEVIEATDVDASSDPAAMLARIEAMHAQAPFDFAATCGSNRLFRMVRDFCADRGVAGQIVLEARMGCGLGMCLACVAPIRTPQGGTSYRRVCYDGPVFDIQEATGWQG